MLRKLMYTLKNGLKRNQLDTTISQEEMIDLQNQGAVLVDVRSPQEYKEGHLNSAILLPEYEIERKAAEILEDKNQMIVVYCSTGSRSKKAKKRLEKMGYQKVFDLEEGIYS